MADARKSARSTSQTCHSAREERQDYKNMQLVRKLCQGHESETAFAWTYLSSQQARSVSSALLPIDVMWRLQPCNISSGLVLGETLKLGCQKQICCILAVVPNLAEEIHIVSSVYSRWPKRNYTVFECHILKQMDFQIQASMGVSIRRILTVSITKRGLKSWHYNMPST